LSDLINGTLAYGVVPMARMIRSEEWGKNAGVLAIAAGPTQSVQIVCLGLLVGDRVLVASRVRLTKGAVPGLCGFRILTERIGGGAGGVWCEDLAFIRSDEANVPSLDDHNILVNGIFRVTQAGDIAFNLQGYSAGSNSAVPAGEAQLHAIALVGA